jgi:tetratricopeptide (TPR) repeat protein
MSEQVLTQGEELRQSALAKVRAGEVEEALALYDQALAMVEDEDARELLVINKADAMIAIERSGPEVQALPKIVMRRRNPHHTFLAAYALAFKFRTENELKRAAFYGQLAFQTANEANEPLWKIGALNELSVIFEIDSQFAKAIESCEAALRIIDAVEDEADQSFSRVAILATLGYNKIITGATDEGIQLMESVLGQIQNPTVRADALTDLCYGYIDRGEYATAIRYGEEALTLAAEPRQIRNAHYLLGEAAYQMGNTEAAEFHFDKLAAFYPEFRHLKSLLFAIDLRSMVNLKL